MNLIIGDICQIRIVGRGIESKLGPLGHVGHFWPIVPAPGDCEDEDW
jgi:hypothetical protein